MMALRFHNVDDETIEIFVGDDFIGMVNHDNDGWAGMETVQRLLIAFADKLGVPVKETYDE